LVDWCRTAEKPTEPHDPAAHAALAVERAIEGAVLLANDGALPLSADATELVVVGELFERMRFQGAGSSLITPSALVTPRDAFEARGIRYRYARGYRALAEESDADLARQAIAAVDTGDTVLVLGGLTAQEDREDIDRTKIEQTAGLVELIDQTHTTGSR